jgi:hypothetical protein
MGMTREDWHRAAEIVEELSFDGEAMPHEQQIWNMAILAAARSLRRAGMRAPWAADDIDPRAADTRPAAPTAPGSARASGEE